MSDFKQNIVLAGARRSGKHALAAELCARLGLMQCGVGALLRYERQADKSVTATALCGRLKGYTGALFVLDEGSLSARALRLLSQNAYIFYVRLPRRELFRRYRADGGKLDEQAYGARIDKLESALGCVPYDALAALNKTPAELADAAEQRLKKLLGGK